MSASERQINWADEGMATAKGTAGTVCAAWPDEMDESANHMTLGRLALVEAAQHASILIANGMFRQWGLIINFRWDNGLRHESHLIQVVDRYWQLKFG